MPYQAPPAYHALQARLDPDQRACVAHAGGNALWKAAAGSGKTSVVIAYAARLLVEQVCAPQRLYLLTFTRKAADEMNRRLASVVPPYLFQKVGHVGTYHRLAIGTMLRREPLRWDLTRNVEGKDGSRAGDIPASKLLWWQVIRGKKSLPGCDAEQVGLGMDDEPRDIASTVALLRSRGVRFGTEEACDAAKGLGPPGLYAAWELYERVKRGLDAWDFQDALEAYQDVLLRTTGWVQPDVVVVDEAQDNDRLQLRLAETLADGKTLILCQDERQVIFTWRGAASSLGTSGRRPVKTYTLSRNYRSVPAVVDAANRLSEGRPWSSGPAQAVRTDAGEVRGVAGLATPADEAAYVADSILAKLREGVGASDIAILTRTNAKKGMFETACVGRRIPVVVVGDVPFWSHPEVRVMVAYARLLEDDDAESLERICNLPKRYLGAAFLKEARTHLQRSGSLLSALRNVQDRYKGAADLADTLVRLRALPWTEALPEAAAVLNEAYVPPLDESGRPEADGRRSLVTTAAWILGRFEGFVSAASFIARCEAEVATASEEHALPAGRVTISTVHAAKGREWSNVYVSCARGEFPQSEEEENEEEERLLYVATTRAKDRLVYTWSDRDQSNRQTGPSPLLEPLMPVLFPTVKADAGRAK